MDFRKKLLALAVSAMGFAGIASAQLFPCGANDAGSANITGLPNILRVEATNDEATDLSVSCATGSTLTSGSVVVQLNATVTSTQVSPLLNEATLNIIQGAVVVASYPGVVSGNQVVFGGTTGVQFPATAYTMTVQNIRVNSSALAIGTYVTETLNVYNQGVVAYTTNSPSTVTNGGIINVGFVQQGFTVPNNLTNLGLSNAVNYTLCVGNLDGISFTLNLGEKFGGAFKTKVPTVNTVTGAGILCGTTATACTATNGEQGTYQDATPGVGTANSGTRFLLSFAGVPSGVTIYLPVSITGNTGLANPDSAPLVFTLTSSATGAFAAVPASTTVGFAGQAPITATNGVATAVYEVTSTDNTVPTETVSINGVFSFAANFATTAQGPVTVTVTPAPSGSTNVPNFAPSSNTAINLSSWVPCTTSLLFPFVTNQLGFDTGIVLSNTSTDPFGTAVLPIGGASPAPGACTLNFYGAGAPTPSTGVAAPGGSQASGTVNAFQVSSVAPGFQGYVISVCNYLYGHGYAFIEFDLTQGNGIAEGYLPLVITDRGGGGGLNEALNN